VLAYVYSCEFFIWIVVFYALVGDGSICDSHVQMWGAFWWLAFERLSPSSAAVLAYPLKSATEKCDFTNQIKVATEIMQMELNDKVTNASKRSGYCMGITNRERLFVSKQQVEVERGQLWQLKHRIFLLRPCVRVIPAEIFLIWLTKITRIDLWCVFPRWQSLHHSRTMIIAFFGRFCGMGPRVGIGTRFSPAFHSFSLCKGTSCSGSVH